MIIPTLVSNFIRDLLLPLAKGGKVGFYNKNTKLLISHKISPNPSLLKRGIHNRLINNYVVFTPFFPFMDKKEHVVVK